MRLRTVHAIVGLTLLLWTVVACGSGGPSSGAAATAPPSSNAAGEGDAGVEDVTVALDPETPERGDDPSPENGPGELRPPDPVPAEPAVAPPVTVAAALEPAAWAARTLAAMTLRQKVGQMIMPRILGDFSPVGSEAFESIARLVESGAVGGVIVSTGTPMDVATKLNILQRRAPVPLLVAADLETGAGFRMRGAVYLPGATDLGGATDFPALMALGAAREPRLAYEMGRITAVEARALGIHVPFAPVLDVNNNPENPVINTRSIGEDPDLVSTLGVCLVRGIQDHGGIATGKHFPGHGDTDTDSHLALPIIRLGRDRMDGVELLPFRRAIDGGMRAVMTAHIALPELAEAPNLPATLSRNVITGILRGEMGFDGLVFTDAMNMSAIDGLFGRDEAVVRAVEAGADVVLMPFDANATVGALATAVEIGRVPESRIDESVMRILTLKAELGLSVVPTVDLEAVFRDVGTPAHTDVARELAERSVTLLQNHGDLVPLAGTRTANVLSVTFRRDSDLLAGRAFDARLRETYPRLRSVSVGAGTTSEEFSRIASQAENVDLVVVSLYLSEVSREERVAGSRALMDFMRRISGSGVPNIAISFGNPYLITDFPDVRAYVIAWGDADASQRAAAGAILGQRAIGGRIPIRIPPSFPIGAGIQVRGPSVAAGSSTAVCE